MDRIEPRNPKGPYADEAEVADSDRPLLVTPTGRESGTHNPSRSVADQEIDDKSVGSRPVSDVTDVHDEGSGANETDDGLDEISEGIRHNAEDLPTGADPLGPIDDVPVFDRGSLPPKV